MPDTKVVNQLRTLADNIERFQMIQERDGLPDPDTGITHCYECHGAYTTISAYQEGPLCGHIAGCPEC